MEAEQDKRELEERIQMLEEELGRAHQSRVRIAGMDVIMAHDCVCVCVCVCV